jgi:predicted GIY-YIG superfamily endonuclease
MKDYVLYRFFNEEKLLYVGQSIRCYDRFKQHQNREFYKESTNITLERFFSSSELNEKEIEAIKKEHPTYNVTHNPKGLKSPDFQRSTSQVISIMQIANQEPGFFEFLEWVSSENKKALNEVIYWRDIWIKIKKRSKYMVGVFANSPTFRTSFHYDLVHDYCRDKIGKNFK